MPGSSGNSGAFRVFSGLVLPCVLFEDEDLLVVNKPPGLNTHSPEPHAGEGIYEFLRNRQPEWSSLAIIHRLDKETSGVLVFSKTRRASQSLTAQFTAHEIRKTYRLLTDRPAPARLVARSTLVRAGDRYFSRPLSAGSTVAETCFSILKSSPNGRLLIEAKPLTGRTHQIRVHASEHGFPILGDSLYGGTPGPRLCLHAARLRLAHPADGRSMEFEAPCDFQADPRQALRDALIDPAQTDACRLIHGASDGFPGWYVDRLGDYLLSQSAAGLTPAQEQALSEWRNRTGARGVYHKILSRRVRGTSPAETSPRLVLGQAAPDPFHIRENGLRFALSFNEGYSVGLFLDQRENRRRLLARHIAPGFVPPPPGKRWEVLNTFAYTCGFSVCAAGAAASVTSLDLSRKYLDWGRRNFVANSLDPGLHDFIFGDTFDWLRRLAKRGRIFDVVLLDPPTFSQSRQTGAFRAQKDYGRLVISALAVLRTGGLLLASTNAADWPPADFRACVRAAFRDARRRIQAECYVPQPHDFPVSRQEPAYLKTLWLQAD